MKHILIVILYRSLVSPHCLQNDNLPPESCTLKHTNPWIKDLKSFLFASSWACSSVEYTNFVPFSTQSPLASRCPMTCAVEMKRGRKLDVWWPVEAKQKKVKASMRPSAKRRVEYSKTLRITLLKRASFSKPPFWGFKMLVFGVCNYIYISSGFKYFYVHHYVGRWSNTTYVFQMDWNHHLVLDGWERCSLTSNSYLTDVHIQMNTLHC